MPDYTYVPSVDLSYSRLDATGRQCLFDEEVEFLWQCGWTSQEQPANCVSNLQTWQASGKRSGLYISLNSSMPGRWHVDQARATIPEDVWNKLRIVAIDVELAGITVAQCIDAVQRIEELGKKIVLREVACYASWNSWLNLLVGTPEEKLKLAQMGVLLINAYWDGAPDIDFARLPYGGWTLDTLLGEQYDGGHVTCGSLDVDSDMFNAELLAEVVAPTPVPDEEDPMLKAQIAAAGIFLQIKTKLEIGLALPVELRDAGRFLLGGTTPNTESSDALLIVLCDYAAARALTGEQIDDDTRNRLRYAVR